jgi:hypothetical protein
VHEQDPTDPTGVKVLSERTDPATVRARDRKANAALQMRTAMADWEEIAQVLGYPSGRAAQVATEKALERELRTEQSRKHMRHLATRRLEALLRSIYDKATNPDHPEHLAALREARATIDRHAKLHGYDAPTEFVVNTPTSAQIEEWVAGMLSADTAGLPEVDIFDVEWTEDSEEPAAIEAGEVHSVKTDA